MERLLHDIRAQTEGDYAIILVDSESTDRTVERAIREHIFEPFFTTRDDSGGIGLGLPISRTIIEEHGGSLVLCSERTGASFQIQLPAAPNK